MDLTQLIPSNIRNPFTINVVKAIQEVAQQLFDEADKIKLVDTNKPVTDIDFIKNFCFMIGYPIQINTGYASSLEYLNRQLQTIISRIKTKTTPKSYEYLNYIYQMLNHVYPLYQDIDGTLVPLTSFEKVSAFDFQDQTLDWGVDDNNNPLPSRSELFLDAGSPNLNYIKYVSMDTDELMDTEQTMDVQIPYYGVGGVSDNWVLDQNLKNFLTRHFVYNIIPKYIETEDSFYRFETLQALVFDVLWNKRAIEIPHFQYNIFIYLKHPIFYTFYTDYTFNLQGEQRGVYFPIDNGKPQTLIDSYKIQLGTGSQSAAQILAMDSFSNPIPSPVGEFIIADDCKATIIDANNALISNKINLNTRILTPSTPNYITEMTIKNAKNRLIAYATFPKMYVDTSHRNTFLFKVKIV
jgi:hypothetical protein